MEVPGPVLVKLILISFVFDLVLVPVLLAVGGADDLGRADPGGSVGENVVNNFRLELGDGEGIKSSVNKALHINMDTQVNQQ